MGFVMIKPPPPHPHPYTHTHHYAFSPQTYFSLNLPPPGPGTGITPGASTVSIPFFILFLVQREIWEECALNFKVGGLIVFFIKAAV